MIKSLQSLRLVFVLMVFFSHFSWGGSPYFSFGGECGVSFFFILSGFVLSIGYGEKIDNHSFSLKHFLLKQLSKFYPLHILLLSAFIALDVARGYGVDVVKLLLSIFLLQSWVPDNGYNYAYNGVAWFLSDVMFFYICFPLLYKTIMRASTKMLAAMSAVGAALYAGVIYIVPSNLINTLVYVFPPVRMVDFIIGIVIYRLYVSQATTVFRRWTNGRRSLAKATLVELFAVIIIVLAYIVHGNTPAQINTTVVFIPVLPTVIYLFAVTDSSNGLVTHLLHSKKLIGGGKLSLEFYLTHTLVISLGTWLLYKGNIDLGYALTAGLCIITTLAVSVLIKKYFADKLYFALRKNVIKI